MKLQHSAGNAVVSRLIQRVTVGTHKAAAGGAKTWEAMGGFSTKHLLDDELNAANAKAKWTARFQKDPKGWRNTVVAKADLAAALQEGKVKGEYPRERTPQRNPLVVEVPGMTVTGRNRNGVKEPGAVTNLTQIGVAGSATGTIYFPDHLEGTLSS